jgi:hypothetical protein
VGIQCPSHRVISMFERLRTLVCAKASVDSLDNAGGRQRTCGITACNILAPASNSAIVLSMFASVPTATHKQGIKRALNDTLAARRATLKPCSGWPTLLKRSALAMRTEMRCMTSAPCSFRSTESSSMAPKASVWRPRATRQSMRVSASKNDSSGSVDESGFSDDKRASVAVQSALRYS